VANDLVNQARTLLGAINTLSSEVEELNKKFDQVNKDVYQTVQRMKLLVTGLAIVTTLSLGALGYAIYNGEKVSHIQQRTSNEVLCPLYRLFLSSYHPEAQPPEKRESYEEAFKVIRKSYGALECDRG
jgi:preprotein translocase subunit Sec63